MFDKKAYDAQLAKKIRTERRAMLLDGKVCERCGFDDPRALEFHHRNPAEKEFTVGSLMTKSLERLLAEVAKCEIICANCHAIEHAPMVELVYT